MNEVKLYTLHFLEMGRGASFCLNLPGVCWDLACISQQK